MNRAPLDRAVILLAAHTGLPADEAATVDVGRRDALLAAALAQLAGDVVWTSIECATCCDRLDVPVDIAAVARLPARGDGEVLVTAVDGTLIPFRLPSTADLAALGACDPAQGRRLLLARCVSQGAQLPAAMAEAVEEAMECAAPAGAVQIAVSCAGCGAVTDAALDVSILLWAEVEVQVVSLLHDIHALARSYGWTEAEVLALSPQRRAAYLELATS